MKKIISMIMSILLTVSAFSVLSFESAAENDKHLITAQNPAVVIRSSFATADYEGGWGGVFEAAPVKDKEGYVLYDVIIWEDRINLYKFPDYLEENEENGYDTYNEKFMQGNYEDYYKWRESFCIKSIACEDTENKEKSSVILRDAFIEFFRIVETKTPSENIVLKYSGHGDIGYSGCMNVPDTKIMLEKGVEIFGQKFALIDFGTNCRSGTTDYLKVYHKYTDYLLLSQLDAGGYSMDEWDYEQYKKYDSDYRYSDMFNVGSTVEQAGKNIVDITTEFWKLCKNNIVKGKHRQSMTLVDARVFESFEPELAELMFKVSADNGTDVYTLVKNKGDSNIQKLYNALVIYYKDNNNKDYFLWDKECGGLTGYVFVYKAELSETSLIYDGKVKNPSVIVTLTNGSVLTDGEGYDYEVSYSEGRKKPGKYKVTVSFCYGYDDDIELSFEINPRPKLKKVTVSKVTAKKKGFNLKWKAAKGDVSGYQVQYSLMSSFASAKSKTVKKSGATSTTVKKLKGKKKYFVRVRAYKTVDGEKLYSPWSKKKTVRTL